MASSHEDLKSKAVLAFAVVTLGWLISLAIFPFARILGFIICLPLFIIGLANIAYWMGRIGTWLVIAVLLLTVCGAFLVALLGTSAGRPR